MILICRIIKDCPTLQRRWWTRPRQRTTLQALMAGKEIEDQSREDQSTSIGDHHFVTHLICMPSLLHSTKQSSHSPLGMSSTYFASPVVWSLPSSFSTGSLTGNILGMKYFLLLNHCLAQLTFDPCRTPGCHDWPPSRPSDHLLHSLHFGELTLPGRPRGTCRGDPDSWRWFSDSPGYKRMWPQSSYVPELDCACPHSHCLCLDGYWRHPLQPNE